MFRISRRKLSISSMAIAAGLLLAPAAEADTATRGGTITYARYIDSELLDPVLNDSNSDIWIIPNIYNTLLEQKADGTIAPMLATEWKFEDEGKTLRLTIRPSVKFSDGTDMTLDDIVWSLDRARVPDVGAWSFLLASIDKVETAGDNQIVIRLKNPDLTILPALTTFNASVMPRKLVEAEKGATIDEKATNFANHPVGTGPFMMKSWERDVAMTLVPNPHYWRKGDDGKALPYVDEVKLTVVPDDATRILQLKSGQVDGIEQVPYAQAGDLKQASNVRMELWPATRLTYLTVRAYPTLKNGDVNPIGDVKVRQALQYALDKDAIIQVATHGIGTKMKSFIPSATPMFYGEKTLFDYDPVKAKQLLAEAGYPDGFPVTCLLLANSSDEQTNLTLVQQMWEQVGVKMTIETLDNASRNARYNAEDFQCRVQFWTNDIADPSQITSYVAYYPNVHSLHTGYNNDELNKAYEASLTEGDPEKRAQLYKKIQEIYSPTGPMIYLYETPFPVAFNAKTKGFVQTPLGTNVFEGAYKEP
jgi:peptide/nickel transport system substrate-binding protein